MDWKIDSKIPCSDCQINYYFFKAPVTLIVNAFQRSCVQAISIWKSSQRLMNSFPTCDFTVVTNLELFWQVDLKSG
jgi:hypothetical protein